MLSSISADLSPVILIDLIVLLTRPSSSVSALTYTSKCSLNHWTKNNKQTLSSALDAFSSALSLVCSMSVNLLNYPGLIYLSQSLTGAHLTTSSHLLSASCAALFAWESCLSNSSILSPLNSDFVAYVHEL